MRTFGHYLPASFGLICLISHSQRLSNELGLALFVLYPKASEPEEQAMSDLIVWMDSQEAKIFRVKAQGISTDRFQFDFKNTKCADNKRCFHHLVNLLNSESSERWVLLSPDLSGQEFQNFLQAEYPLLAKRIVMMKKVGPLIACDILTIGRKTLMDSIVFQEAQ